MGWHQVPGSFWLQQMFLFSFVFKIEQCCGVTDPENLWFLLKTVPNFKARAISTLIVSDAIQWPMESYVKYYKKKSLNLNLIEPEKN